MICFDLVRRNFRTKTDCRVSGGDHFGCPLIWHQDNTVPPTNLLYDKRSERSRQFRSFRRPLHLHQNADRNRLRNGRDILLSLDLTDPTAVLRWARAALSTLFPALRTRERKTASAQTFFRAASKTHPTSVRHAPRSHRQQASEGGLQLLFVQGHGRPSSRCELFCQELNLPPQKQSLNLCLVFMRLMYLIWARIHNDSHQLNSSDRAPHTGTGRVMQPGTLSKHS